MRRNRLLVMLMLIVVACLCVDSSTPAQTDRCAECSYTKADCIYDCDWAYRDCIDSGNSDRASCDWERSSCLWSCDDEYMSCRAAYCRGWDDEGGGSSGRDPECVAYCDRVEGDCLNGNPMLSGGYMDCVDNGGTASECCRVLRNECVLTCPPCDPRVNCPKFP